MRGTRAVISRSWLATSLIFTFLLFCPVNTRGMDASLLNGRVTDIEGRPAKDAVIFVYSNSNTRKQPDFASPGSDSDGRFRIALPPGRYWAVARVNVGDKSGPVQLGGKHSGEPVEIEIVTGKDTEQDFVVADVREIARARKNTGVDVIRISGRILDSEGKPVKMAYAIASRSKNLSEVPEFISGWTDETGSYTLYLPKGKYHIGVASEFPPGEGDLTMREMNIEGDKGDIDIVIVKSSKTSRSMGN